jgi:hypothetical protein
MALAKKSLGKSVSAKAKTMELQQVLSWRTWHPKGEEKNLPRGAGYFFP